MQFFLFDASFGMQTATIGSRIREVRNNQNLSQEEFATLLDVSRSVLSQIEIDKIRPSVEFITRLVKVFNVDYRWLVEGNSPAEEDLSRYPQRMSMDYESAHPRPSEKGLFDFLKSDKSEKKLFSKQEMRFENISDTTPSYNARIEPFQRDREMPLITGPAMDEYPRMKDNKSFLNQLSWIRIPTDSNKYYRAFAIPDMRLSPFLEKGDIVVGYKIEDKHTLVPMSYYVFVTERRIIFGMVSMILPDKEISVVENPLMQRPLDYAWDAIIECWMVDKLITDNFVSRFRYMQMILQNIGGSTTNTEKF